jgi:hypothetical protein
MAVDDVRSGVVATSSPPTGRRKVSERVQGNNWVFTWQPTDAQGRDTGNSYEETGGYAQAPGATSGNARTTGTAGTTGANSAQGTSLGPGSNTPFGTIIGNGDNALPSGLGYQWHNLLLTQLQNMATNTGYNWTWDATKGQYVQGQKTVQQALADATRLFQEGTLTGTFNGQPTLAAQQLKQQADQFAVSSGISRDTLNASISQFNQTFALNSQKQAFDQALQVTNLEANPRTRIQASFMGATRGGLGIRQGADQGTPGSAAHYATQVNADGSQTHFYGSPTVDSEGNFANVPVGAFTNALMQGKNVASAGSIDGTGGYTTADDFRKRFDLNKVRLSDYLNAKGSEQQEFLGASSFAGNDDASTMTSLNRFAPRERSVFGGALSR